MPTRAQRYHQRRPSAAARAADQEGGDQGAGGDAQAGGNTPAAAPITARDAPADSRRVPLPCSVDAPVAWATPLPWSRMKVGVSLAILQIATANQLRMRRHGLWQ